LVRRELFADDAELDGGKPIAEGEGLTTFLKGRDLFGKRADDLDVCMK
jgi:hypothetical protein